MAKTSKTHPFRAETRKVLNILTHSLYTNREIFLRELLSNASDALEKLRFLQNKGEDVRDASLPPEIRVSAEKEAGLLVVADSGVGMTEKEMIENLGTIARSGSEQFARDLRPQDAAPPESSHGGEEEAPQEDAGEAEAESGDNRDASQIIGRFGVGFYSVFMVADKVEVTSLSAQSDEPPHVWASTGSGSFTMRTLEGDEAAGVKRGTTVRAKLKADAAEFLEKFHLEAVIRKHSQFLPFPILLEGDRVNTSPALWREPKFSISKEQYNDFYRFLSYDSKPPQDVIHLSVDAPVQFTALIFIPDSANDYFNEQRDEWGLDLYARRVLVERHNNRLIPNYLAFLKGVVDTEDLPLNISRETLQENVVLRKIAQTILKHVLTHLENMAGSEKSRYEAFWKLHGRYFKFAFSDYANRDRVLPLMRFFSSAAGDDELVSLDDYLSRIKSGQQEIWYVSSPSREAARVNPHLERFRRRDLEVLCLLDAVDEFALESLREYRGHPFKSVEQADSKALDAFGDGGEEEPAALSDDDRAAFDQLLAGMRAVLGDQIADIRVSDRLAGSPACLVSPDGVTSSMEKLMRVMQKSDGIPKKILEVNSGHPLLRSLLRIHRADPENPLLADMILNLFDATMLLDGYLNEPYTLADRTLKLLRESASWYADLRRL